MTTDTQAAVQQQPAATAGAGNQVQLPKPQSLESLSAGTSKVMAIVPSNMDQVWRLAKAIALAGWAPKHYKNNDGEFEQEKIAVAIMHGMEVGFTPIAALQSIAVINGMPSIYGDGALALVLASGLMEDYKETRILEGGKVVGYTFWAKRRGKATPIEQKFTREDATRAKLIGKSGPWTEYETRMYQMRARGWGLRDGFADVLKGLAIAEEAMDINPPPANETAGAQVNQRGAAGLRQALGAGAADVSDATIIETARTDPPAAAETVAQPDAGAAPASDEKKKPAGTLEDRNEIVGKFTQCKDIDILDLAGDQARDFEWIRADQEVINAAYNARRIELEKA